MKKILFGITGLTLGGAERVLVDLANALCNEFDITIFTLYDKGTLKQELLPNVKTISLYDRPFNQYNKLQKILISLKLIFINKPPKGYDVYVAFLEGPITRLFAKLKDKRKIAWVHNDVSKVFGNSILAKIKKILDKNKYKKYDKIVFVSKENQKDFNETYGNGFNETLIKNFLNHNAIIQKSKEKEEIPFDSNNINLLTVCRLVEQKAIDRFINVQNMIKRDGIKCKVYIVGDGPLKNKLQRQIDELDLSEDFILLGEKNNPYPYIKNADYFCLLSYFEGYGMVLDEAKILNKKIIITNTASIESVQNYANAVVLENNETDIYKGLKSILENGFKTKEKIEEKFETSKYYDNLIKEIKNILVE